MGRRRGEGRVEEEDGEVQMGENTTKKEEEKRKKMRGKHRYR